MNHVPFEPGNSAADLLIRVPGICAAAENLAYSVDFKSLCRELNVKADILHICHNHHNRWLCKNIKPSVKFANGYVKETAVILHKMCSFTKSV